MSDPVVIVGLARTPMGAFQGAFSSVSAPQLGAAAIKAAVAEAGVDAEKVEQTIMGCVLPAGQGQAPARQAAIHAGLSKNCEATTVNKMCGSGMQAAIMLHDAIKAGSVDLGVAGGMENMTKAPYLMPSARSGARMGDAKMIDSMMYDGLTDAYEGGAPGNASMGVFADMIAAEYQLTREAQDAYAIESVARAKAAQDSGAFDRELTTVTVKGRKGDIVVELFENEAPNSVANFVSLVEDGFYSDILFHRVIEEFMAQTGGFKLEGDKEVGGEGPGYEIACECYTPDKRMHFSGSLSMAHRGKDTGGSQFFLTFERTGFLDGRHTCFGRVIEGFDVLEMLARTHIGQNKSGTGRDEPIPNVTKDKIISAEVLRKRDHKYRPKKIGGEEEPEEKVEPKKEAKDEEEKKDSSPELSAPEESQKMKAEESGDDDKKEEPKKEEASDEAPAPKKEAEPEKESEAEESDSQKADGKEEAESEEKSEEKSDDKKDDKDSSQ